MTPQDYKERNEIIYRMRVEEKKKLKEIGDHFGLSSERIRGILAKIERINAAEERRKAADPSTIGAMKLSVRLRNGLWNSNYFESTPVITVLEEFPLIEMIKTPTMGRKTIEEFASEAKKIVGAEAVQRWLDGKPPRE